MKKYILVLGLCAVTTAFGVQSSGAVPKSPVSTPTPVGEEEVFDPATGKWYRRTPSITERPMPERYNRRIVPFVTSEPPGTLILNTRQKYLYYVLPDGQAIRYGIGVGRMGFEWVGVVNVGRKAEWPTWVPPKEMVERDSFAAEYAKGIPGGPDNPLGARALYLYEGKKDTLYRIHGTNAPWSIGLNVSSGCIRMLNEDVIDLYNRVQVGARVIVVMPAVLGYEEGGAAQNSAELASEAPEFFQPDAMPSDLEVRPSGSNPDSQASPY